MSDNFQNLKNSGVIGSVVAGVTGLILCVSPTPIFVKTISNWITIGSLGSLAATQLLVDSAEKISISERKRYEFDDQTCKLDLKNLQNSVDKLFVKLKNAESELTEKVQLTEKLSAKKLELETIVSSLKSAIDKKNELLSSTKKVSSNTAVEMLNDSFLEFQESVEGLINNTEKAYPTLKNWDVYRTKFSELTNAFTNEITVIMTCDDANDVIEMSLALQHRVITQGSFLKGRIYRAVEIHLKKLLKDTISCDEHDNDIARLLTEFENYKIKIKVHYEGNYQAVISEYASLVDTANTTYQQDLKEICQQGLSDADLIEVLKAEIIRLKEELAIVTKPLTFPGLSPQSIAGNAIINYYHKIGYCLDAIDWESTETGYKLLFHVGRNGSKSVFAEHLNDGENPEKIKEAVTNALNTPKFSHNMRGGHMVLEIQTSYPQKKKQSESDISRMVGSSEEFIKYIISNPIRYRLIADPGKGKTPTTAVMLSEILKVGCTRGNTGKGEKVPHTLVTVSYPGAESSLKDGSNYPLEPFLKYGNETAAVKSFADCLADGQYRKRNTRYASEFFHIWVWDEFDNTINSADDPKGTGENIKHILKQFGHNNIGWIVSGQSVMTKQSPGFTNDDRTLFTQIIIDIPKIRKYLKTYGDETLSSDVVSKLVDNLGEIEEYVNEKNNFITDDARLLRVALILDSRSPKLYFLPNLDIVDFNTQQIEETRALAVRSKESKANDGVLTKKASTPYPICNGEIDGNDDGNDYALTKKYSNLDTASSVQIFESSSFPPMGDNRQNDQTCHCPHCGSSNLKMLSDGRYRCLNCDKRMIESKLVWR